jgi:hypothetical protein
VRLPKPPNMSDLVRQGQERARKKGTIIGRPKGAVSRKLELRHRRLAAEVDALVATGEPLKSARGIMANRAGKHVKTIERAHRKFGKRLRDTKGTKKSYIYMD